MKKVADAANGMDVGEVLADDELDKMIKRPSLHLRPTLEYVGKSMDLLVPEWQRARDAQRPVSGVATTIVSLDERAEVKRNVTCRSACMFLELVHRQLPKMNTPSGDQWQRFLHRVAARPTLTRVPGFSEGSLLEFGAFMYDKFALHAKGLLLLDKEARVYLLIGEWLNENSAHSAFALVLKATPALVDLAFKGDEPFWAVRDLTEHAKKLAGLSYLGYMHVDHYMAAYVCGAKGMHI